MEFLVVIVNYLIYKPQLQSEQSQFMHVVHLTHQSIQIQDFVNAILDSMYLVHTDLKDSSHV